MPGALLVSKGATGPNGSPTAGAVSLVGWLARCTLTSSCHNDVTVVNVPFVVDHALSIPLQYRYSQGLTYPWLGKHHGWAR